MRTLYFDCGMGAAGDMLTASLFELLSEEQKKECIDKLNNMGLETIEFVPEKSTKCGILGTHMSVLINGEEEVSADDHDHEHDHHHHHHHTSMADIEHIIGALEVSDRVKENALSVYRLIQQAESKVHGKSVDEIHFHEVGNKDAIADVVGFCYILEMLEVEKIVASPVHVGCGRVKCAHGILPVPAPATAEILSEVPIYGGMVKGELCTPTGAAILKHFVDEFDDMPIMTVKKTGYGMGKKDFEIANCVRAILGDVKTDKSKIVELTCNVDDMTAERIGFAMEELFNAGALEVYTVSVGMKKSRPGIMLCVMCAQDKKENIINLIFRHTTTLGIRENISKRYTLERRIDTKETSLGTVRVKVSNGFCVERKKYEYEDLAKIAREKDISIEEVVNTIEME